MQAGDSQQPPTDYYEQRLKQLSFEETGLVKWNVRLSRIRGLVFLTALSFALVAWNSDQSWSIWYVPTILFFLGFVFFVGWHEKLLGQLEVCRQRNRLNVIQQARCRRDWEQIPTDTTRIDEKHSALARDLDVCGRASLLHWLSLAQTPMGNELLRDWLLVAAEPEEVLARQEAARRLAAETTMREELQIRGRLVSLSGHGPAAFVSWAEGPAWLCSRPLLLWGTRLIAIATVVSFGLLLALGPIFPVLAVLVSICLVNVLINVRFVPTIHQQFNIVASRQNEVEQYRAAFRLFSQLPDDCRWLNALKRRMSDGGSSPIRLLDQLARRVRFAAARNSWLWGLPYVLLQWVLLWDFHVLWLIEGWQKKHGHHARNWFVALAELEAIFSISAVAHDNPDWAFPEVSMRHSSFAATRLGHPLIPDDARVANDVSVGPEGTFLLVTGSNMSGKSTLLRSVGVNILLGQAGAPVCAASCKMPSLAVATSMRVDDSLADGVSFYLAELKRLKSVVDHADQLCGSTHRKLIYLLDEILLGTNSAERKIAVVHVVKHLLGTGAIGVISTHDLELASSPELASACQCVHFREHIEDCDGKRRMTFDYTMRSGIATTTNALKLLELVGLGVVDEAQH